jgi:sucrose phosphorylase
LLTDPDSEPARVLPALRARPAIRCRQKAFHPNATQFTLQLGSAVFGFWRQSLDRDQSIFALHNVSRHAIALPAVSINLIGGEDWVDLLTGEAVNEAGGTIAFAPYQCRWIANCR